MMKIEKKDILIIFILFSVALLIRIVGVSNVCMYGDEWQYWRNTNTIVASNFTPVYEVFDYSPPLFSYIGAAVTLLFGGNLNTLRMISVVFGSFTVLFLYLFGKAMYDRRTGVLAALFLCFSAYHCLYSRIIMLEALTLFFITAFLYFFWLSQCSKGKKSTRYAIVAGAMMGLSIDTKYISMFLIPAILAYTLWTKRFRFKALLDKRIILVLIFAFLFVLPLIICLIYTDVGFHGFYYFSIERFELGGEYSGTRAQDLPVYELVMRGVKSINGVLTWGAVTLIPPWTILFLASSLLLFLSTVFYYSRNLISREKKGSFLIILLLMLFAELFVCPTYQHYLIYLFPFYFVMVSHLVVKSFEHLRQENNYKNIFCILIILLTAIVLSSSTITAVTSHYWDKGDYDPWVESAVEYVKDDINKGDHEEPILIGTFTYGKYVDYHFYISDLNVSTYCIIKQKSKYGGKIVTIDLETINILKPMYIITSEDFYKQFFTDNVKRELFKDYMIVFHSQGHPYEGLILKRKNMQPMESVYGINGKDGEISRDIFEKSVPNVMEVGKIYTASVKVRNTGDSRTDFIILVHSDIYTIFVEDEWHEVTLDKETIGRIESKIVPIRGHTGEIPITVDLYVKYDENETFQSDDITPDNVKKVDSVSDYVYLIEHNQIF